ncbi:MAG: hypothetical protein HY719_00090 [Planctomycetes bacterium]|nr:hypothetical protein [Planctomycetota bacterium]
MIAADVRKVFRKRPFRPLEIVLSSGERFRCLSPEMTIGETMMAVLDDDGGIALLDVAAITSIRHVRQARRSKGASKAT